MAQPPGPKAEMARRNGAHGMAQTRMKVIGRDPVGRVSKVRKRNKKTGFRSEAGNDYGPAFQRVDGELVEWGGAARVMVEIRSDPTIIDRPRPVRGARRRNAIFDLYARGVLTKRQYNAAEQFLDDCSIASGGTAPENAFSASALSGPRSGLPERQVLALTRVQQVRHLLGLNPGTVFWWVVFDNGALAEYERRNRMRTNSATDLLRQALDALDAHFYRNARRTA